MKLIYVFYCSHLTVKPMLGKIQNFGIIAAELRTDILFSKVYKEEWFVELNGSDSRRIPIQFKGMASTPSLSIGDDGFFKFDEKVQIGTTAYKEILLKNNSIFFVR